MNRSFVSTASLSWSLTSRNRLLDDLKCSVELSDLFIKLSLNFFFCLSSVRGRCFWASQILWWILTSSEQKFCFDCKPLLESYLDGIDNADDLKCSVELSDLLSSCHWTFSSVYKAWEGDVFEQQILWWILTSSEQKFCFDCKPLLESYLDGTVALDDLKCSVVLLDLLHVVIELFLLSIKRER